jgi:quercetin dioxygenase-like cupin family protein
VVVEHAAQAWVERRPGSRIRPIVDPTGAVSGLSFFRQECAPGVGAPSHTHEFEEILTVIEGQAEVWLDGQRQVIGPGTSVFVNTGAVHGFRNVGDDVLKLDAIIAARELRQTFVDDPGPP